MVSWRELDTGVKVSGAAHLGLILWAMLGGLFSFERENAVSVSDVTLISSDQFAEMMAAQSRAPDVAPQSAPRPRPAPQPAPQPVETPAPEPAPEQAETPDPVTADAPEPAPQVDEAFEVPQAEVTADAPPTPEQPDMPNGASTVVAPENPPAPDAAPRVAPQPVDRPEPDANVADEVRQAARREDAPEAVPVPDVPQETTAPQEAGTVIETEASQDAGGTASASLAPEGVPRPPRRPNRPAPAAQPAPVEQAASTPAPEAAPSPASDPLADAIASAVAEAAAPEVQAGLGSAPSGPPLTSGEKDALRIAVQRCWNVGALSSDALNTTVTVYVAMQENARPETGSIRMLGYEGGSEAAARQAFDAARRAIIRCGSEGFDLPPEKYSHWREVEMIFNPENMRIR